MNNVLLVLGAILAGILGALVAVPMVIDWNGYRGVFEEEASRLLGRDVRVGGAVNVRILPVPYVRFEKLRIADTASTGGDPLFRAESVTMRLSVSPLLRGVLEAQSVELKKPSLRLVVDSEGRGNWASLSLKPGSLPFVPADVTLQSVGIEGGTLMFVGAAGKDLAEFQGIDGELSADGFEGPFKFKGHAGWYGEPREIRFATTKAENDGALRFRASVRVPANQNTYLFDGRIADLKGRPHLDGELSAKLPIAAAKSAKAGTADSDANAFELKAKAAGDLKGGKLSEIALSLDRPGDPQLITGDATASWADALAFDMALATRSLNLDAIGAEGASKDPLETARNALNVILGSLPAEAKTDARLKAERVTLGGEALNGVTIAMSRRDTTLEVNELRAELPGQTLLDASGQIKRDGKSATAGFAGPVMLRGGNLARFLGWTRGEGAARPKDATGQYEGPFMLDAHLATSGTTAALTRVIAEFGDKPVNGEIRITNEGRRRVEIVLQGPRIDAAQVWPGGFNLDRLRGMLTGRSATTAGSTAGGFYGFNPDTTDVKADVRAGEFQANATTLLRDVTAQFSVERGKLSMPRVRFETAAGLSIDLDGQVAGLTAGGAAPGQSATGALLMGAGAGPQAAHRGVVHYVAAAASADAMTDLMTYLDWPDANRPDVATLAAIGSVRMAGALTLGERGAHSSDLAFDGMVDGGRVFGAVKLDEGFAAWRTGGLDVTAQIETGNPGRWLRYAGMAAKPSSTGALVRPGRIFITAKGQAQSGLTVLGSVTGEDLSLAYQGLVTLPKDGPPTAEGAAGLAARDAGDVIGLGDLSLGVGGYGVAVQGQVEVKLRDNRLALTTSELKAGPARVTGWAALDLARADDVVRKVSADLRLDQASVPGLLSAVSDRRAASQSRDTNQSVWPDQPITFSGLERLEGLVTLAIGRLSLDGAPLLTNAKAKLSLSAGAITVDELTGTGLGGSLSARLALAKAPGGAALTGEGTLTGAALAPDMPVTVTAALTSQGLSASGLVAALKGNGEAIFSAGTIKGVAPDGVAATVDSVLADKQPPTGDGLSDVLRDAMAATALTIGQRTIAFTVADGVARTPATVFQTPQGRATVETMFDANAGRYLTDWRIAANAKPGVTGKPKAPLPPVVVSLSGGLGNLAEADRKMTTAAFEQELGLRKLERDAEELERIRKIDDDRRAQEEADRKTKAAADAAAQAAADAMTNAPVTVTPDTSADTPLVVPAPVEVVRPPAGAPPAGGQGSAAPAPAGGTPAPATSGAGTEAAAPANAPQTGAAVRPSGGRRRQDGIPQPFQQNF